MFVSIRNINNFIVFLLMIIALTPVNAKDLSEAGYQLRINIPSRTLALFYNGSFIKEYPVGVGKSHEFMTPPGKYRINVKVLEPIWEHPYKEAGKHRVKSRKQNPLGKYWMGFHSTKDGAYGIHGTNQPNSVGKFVSHGCVRMTNEDVAELFHLVPEGTELFITYDRYKFKKLSNRIFMEVYPDRYAKKDIIKIEVIQNLARRVDMDYVKLFPKQIELAIKDDGKTANKYEIARFSTPEKLAFEKKQNKLYKQMVLNNAIQSAIYERQQSQSPTGYQSVPGIVPGF